MVRKKIGWLILMVLLVLMVNGCQFNWEQLTKRTNVDNDQLIRVEIVFTDDKTLIGYVKELAINPDSKVYVGGSSSNYLYDAKGNIVGVFNYQRVLYMTILPAEEGQ
ncbi:MAG: hypothetical protein ACOX6F_08520 [Syntrophomonadaceae bacterium]|nr:hypothetical protein [Bacillota bacterium]NLM88395.1 hypothetical protein [Syntrophomonadaceae bacterium]HAA09561.1 hypothetical protein [Syntrophomonas sp.]HQD89378.1 hypothetical protein [Syntrophomonadaceae bacterium]